MARRQRLCRKRPSVVILMALRHENNIMKIFCWDKNSMRAGDQKLKIHEQWPNMMMGLLTGYS